MEEGFFFFLNYEAHNSYMSGSETTVAGRGDREEKLNTLPEDYGANFGISSCPIMMIDSIGYGGQGSVCKLTLHISPSFEVDALPSGMP